MTDRSLFDDFIIRERKEKREKGRRKVLPKAQRFTGWTAFYIPLLNGPRDFNERVHAHITPRGTL